MTTGEARKSFVVPAGLALFGEGGDAFLEVRRAADPRVFENRAIEVSVHTSLFRGNQQAFGAAKATRADFDQIVGQFAGPRHEFLRLDNFADQTELLRLFRGDFAAGEQQISGALVADLTSEKHGNDGGKKTDADFRGSQAGFGNGERKIGGPGQTPSSGKGVTLDRSDERTRERPQAAEK